MGRRECGVQGVAEQAHEGRETARRGMLWRGFWSASALLTVAVVLLGLLSGALLPGCSVATGSLVSAVARHRAPLGPVILLMGLFMAERVLDPLLEEAGQALWRQIDEDFDQRLMTELVGPPGL